MEKKLAKLNFDNDIEYLVWEDNYHEMKIFCSNYCNITYEYAPCLDCYFNLELEDSIRERKVNVPLHSYVIKLDDYTYTYVSPQTFNEYFIKS